MATWAHKGIIVTLENSGPRKKGPQYYRVTWFDPKVGERTCGYGSHEAAALQMFYSKLRNKPVVIDHSTWWKRLWNRKARITW